MEFWNIGFKTRKKFLPIIPSIQFSSVPKYFFYYAIIPCSEDLIDANNAKY
jgi:hypothetical protein